MKRLPFWNRVRLASQRRAARWLARRPFRLPRGQAIVSFTFDDFPRSALLCGGTILQQFGATGTYYASLGIAETSTECGEMFGLQDLGPLLASGHELGCHTYSHCPAWDTAPTAFEESVRRNAAALDRHLPSALFRTLSYPISYPRPATKHRIARHFSCCRGGGQTFNHGLVDLNYLNAFFLEQSRANPSVVQRILLENEAAGGWLIFATHDVTENPSRFGCTPEFFAQVVQWAAGLNALILPVAQAWDLMRHRAAVSP